MKKTYSLLLLCLFAISLNAQNHTTTDTLKMYQDGRKYSRKANLDTFSFDTLKLIKRIKILSADKKTTSKHTAKKQDSVFLIKLNFSTKEYTSSVTLLDKLKRGDYYQLEIDNINLNAYKVTINNRDSITQTGLTIPSLSSSGISGILSTLTALGGAAAPNSETPLTSQRAPLSSQDMLLSIAPNSPSTTAKGAKQPSKASRKKNPSPPRPLSTDDSNKVIKAMGVCDSSFQAAYMNIVQLKKLIDSLNFKVSIFVAKKQLLQPSQSLYKQLDSIVPDIAMAGILKFIINTRNMGQIIKTAIVTSYQTYDTKVLKFRYGIVHTPTLRASDSLLRSVYAAFNKELDTARTNLSPPKITPVLNSLVTVDNNSDRKYLSLPMLFSKDQTTVSIAITPTASTLPSYNTSFTFPIYKKSYWGVSGGFYVSELHDDAYSTKGSNVTATADTTYNVVKENPGIPMEFGFNTLFTVGWNCCRTFSICGQIGPAFAITNVIKPRLQTGGGIALGDKNKVTVTFGANIGYDDRLSQAFNTTTNYITPPTNLIVSVLNIGYYLSVGYVFTF